MAFVRDFISLLFVTVGIFPTLLGIEIAGEQYREYSNTWGMIAGFSISFLGIVMILLGFWLSCRKTRKEKYELQKFFEDGIENKYPRI